MYGCYMAKATGIAARIELSDSRYTSITLTYLPYPYRTKYLLPPFFNDAAH